MLELPERDRVHMVFDPFRVDVGGLVVNTQHLDEFREYLMPPDGRLGHPFSRRSKSHPNTIAILLGFSPLFLLVYSPVILSLMIPFPMIPLVYYPSK